MDGSGIGRNWLESQFAFRNLLDEFTPPTGSGIAWENVEIMGNSGVLQQL